MRWLLNYQASVTSKEEKGNSKIYHARSKFFMMVYCIQEKGETGCHERYDKKMCYKESK